MQVKYLSYPITENDFPETICAIGSFDGVHLGHQQVIASARMQAKERGISTAVIIFEPHPLSILAPACTPPRITPLAAKLELLESQGVELCYVFEFTSSLAQLSETDFVDLVLAKMNLRGVVVGFDFTYGKRGSGSAASLKEQATTGDLFSVTVVLAYLIDANKVSSSRIRELLKSARIPEANQLLGRAYAFRAKVVEGDKRGRELGFPTMNLELIADYIGLQKGVYVVKTKIEDVGMHYGVMNVGVRPTFYQASPKTTYEVHLFDFNQDVYGKEVSVEVIDFLRVEQAFSDSGSLVAAIQRDLKQARTIVSLHLKD